LALDASKSVFIDCPFDEAYATLFDAILFSTNMGGPPALLGSQ